MIIHSPIVSGSLTFANGATFTLPTGGVYSGSFSGSYQGTTFAGGTFSGNGSALTFGGTGIISGSSQLITEFDARYLNTGGDGIVSSSAQVITLLPTGTISGSSQVDGTTITNKSITIAGTSTSLGGSITAATILQGTGVVSGSSQITAGSTTNFATDVKTQLNSNTVVSGSSQIDLTATTNYASGVKTQLDSNTVVSGSAQIVGILSPLNTFSASQETKNSNLATYTGSNDTKWSTLGSLSGSFARTNSTNIFSGNQTITGSLFVSQDLVVAGSSSIQNISSSALVIGAAYVTLNTFSPSSRFAGLRIIDSGSAGSSGSFLYDSVDDEFIFVHKGNGTNVTSSHVVMGPETYDNLGNEIYMTTNRIPKVLNYEHIGDSNISDTGTLITLGSNTLVTGTLLATGTSLVSGSSQIAFSGVTGTVSNAQLANSTISGISLGSNLATLTIGTGLSGTSYNGSTGVTIANTGVTSITGTSNQVNASASTGGVTLSLPQSIATTSNVQFNSLGIGMAASATAGRIDATNDIVAYSSSDIRFKENITPIENAIDKINQIGGYTYDWKEENKIEHGYDGNDVGVIAQEIEAVLPQLVQTRESGYKAVKYDKLVALLIEGIKEQQYQIDELKNKIEKLENGK